MKLIDVEVGSVARLVDFPCSPAHLLRVQELGLREGVAFRITHKAPVGGIVINLGGSRIAIDRGAASQIDVDVEEVAS